MKKEKKLDDLPYLIIKNATNVSQIVYIGKSSSWKEKVGEKFPFDYILTKNDSYTIVQCGLNNYIFETKDCEFFEGKQDD